MHKHITSSVREYLEAVSREVSVAHSLPLNVIIDIVGWIYFLAWSISYYPQVSVATIIVMCSYSMVMASELAITILVSADRLLFYPCPF